MKRYLIVILVYLVVDVALASLFFERYTQNFAEMGQTSGKTYNFSEQAPSGWFSNRDTYAVTDGGDNRGGLLVFINDKSVVPFLGAKSSNSAYTVTFGLSLHTTPGDKDVQISFIGSQWRFSGTNFSNTSLNCFYCFCNWSECDTTCVIQSDSGWTMLENSTVLSYINEGPEPTKIDGNNGKKFSATISFPSNQTLFLMWRTRKTTGDANAFGISHLTVDVVQAIPNNESTTNILILVGVLSIGFLAVLATVGLLCFLRRRNANIIHDDEGPDINTNYDDNTNFDGENERDPFLSPLASRELPFPTISSGTFGNWLANSRPTQPDADFDDIDNNENYVEDDTKDGNNNSAIEDNSISNHNQGNHTCTCSTCKVHGM